MKILVKIIAVFFILNSTLVNAKPIPGSFADLAEKLMPSVVNISTTQTIKTRSNQFDQFPFNFLQAHHLRKCLKIVDRQREKLLLWDLGL